MEVNESIVKTLSLSKQAIEIMKLIFKFSNLTSKQIISYFGWNERTTYFFLQKLEKKKLIFKSLSKFKNYSLYALTTFGKKTLGIKTAKTKTNPFIVEHNQAILTFVKKLDLNLDEFETDSEMKLELTDSKKIPDLIVNKNLNLRFNNKPYKLLGTKTALEFELTVKTKAEYKNIFLEYDQLIRTKHLENVIYLCNLKVFNFFERYKKDYFVNSRIEFVYWEKISEQKL